MSEQEALVAISSSRMQGLAEHQHLISRQSPLYTFWAYSTCMNSTILQEKTFCSIPRRSIVVPRDLEKRRKSLAETVKSDRKMFTPGHEMDEDEVVIEEKISFSKAVGMLFQDVSCSATMIGTPCSSIFQVAAQ